MHVLVCLIDLVGWANLMLAAFWVIVFVLGMFIDIGPSAYWPFQPGQPVQAGGRFVILIYLFIGLVLLANLIGCLSGRPILPDLWPMR